jgi:hypothetical protein
MDLYWKLPKTASGKIRVKFTRSVLKNDKGAVLYWAGVLEEQYIPLMTQFIKNKSANELLNEGMAIADKPYNETNGDNYWNVWQNSLLKENGVADADLPDPGLPTDDQVKVMKDILAQAKYYTWYEYAWNWVGLAGTALISAVLIWAVKHSKKGKSN